MVIDPAKPSGAHALQRLEREAIIWLTTVTPEGQPQSSPIWFVWRDEEILVYSLAETPRVTNIEANPRVALNLNSTPTGVTSCRWRVRPASIGTLARRRTTPSTAPSTGRCSTRTAGPRSV